MRSFLRTYVLKFSISVAIALVLSGALMGSFGTVLAASRSSASQPVVMMVGMNVDCSRVPNTAQAHLILTQHHLCGYGTSSQQTVKTVTPNAVSAPLAVRRIVCGNCGCLILNLFNSGGGWLQWNGEITSSLGWMVYAQYSGYWVKTSGTMGSLSFTNGSGPIFTTDWLKPYPYYTRPGGVFGQINSAYSVLFYGLVCTSVDAVWNVTTVT